MLTQTMQTIQKNTDAHKATLSSNYPLEKKILSLEENYPEWVENKTKMN